MSRRAQYFVLLDEGQWTIRSEGRSFGPYPSQQDAIMAAATAAGQAFEQGFYSQVLVQGENGQLQTEWTCGDDPQPPAA